MPRAISLLTALTSLVTLAGCSWSVFSDLEDQAPATRIGQTGDIKSGAFGDSLVGLERGTEEGGALFASGNGDVSLSTVLFGKGGVISNTATDAVKLKDFFGSPTRVRGVARAPALPTGPAAYVASVAGGAGEVRVIDINRFGLGSTTTLKVLGSWATPVTDFGDSVVDGDFDGVGSRDDLAVGARDAVVAIAAVPGAWPMMNDAKPAVFSGGGFPKGDFTTIVAGEFDGAAPGHEIVAGAPGQNTVVVINRVKDCIDGTSCDGFVALAAPAGAKGFGGALLVADVDGDGKQEVVVGAPDSAQVFVYGVTDPFALELEKTVASPGPPSFGSALAFGRFTQGDGLLAVGAPNAEAGGVPAAGKIFLYDRNLAALGGGGVSLVGPEASMLVGRHLAVLPFRVGSQTHEVLAASGRDAIFVFFSNLVPGHKDLRVR